MEREMIDVTKIGAKIRGLRAEQGMSAETLSDEVDVHKNTILRIERGELSDIGVGLLTEIANALGRTREELIKESQRVR